MSKKRIAIAGIVHETNTYCRGETDKSQFHQLRGEQIFKMSKSDTSLGGALRCCESLGYEIVPLMVASAQPSASIAYETYAEFKSEILKRLDAAKPIDGVFLDLHGAGVVTGIPDLEGDFALALRKQVGEAVPITGSFDLHGNITQTMADAMDGIFACHQYPHIDMHLRAEEAVQLIHRMLKENFRPVIHVEAVPMLMPTTSTFYGVGKETLEYMLSLEEEEGVIDVSWFHGFPYTDVPHIGTYVVVTTESDREQAIKISKKGAAKLWGERDRFLPLSLSADEAVAESIIAAKEATPIVINETSDNCGGGSPGDGTHLLAAMIKAKLKRACFAFIVDPEVADQAHEAGVGATIDISLGAKYDDLHGDPLHLSVYVKALHDGRLTMQAMGKGAPIHFGKLARLVVGGEKEAIDVVVGSRRSQTFDPGPFEAVGIDVETYDFVALKSSNHFRAGFGDLAAKIITADPPGLTTHHVEVFPRETKTYPLWPIDSDASYDP